MANTPNIDLVKPAGTDHALVSVLNSNSDKIDSFAGATNQAIADVGTSTSLGTFSTESSFISALETILSSTSSSGVKQFQFGTSAAFGIFKNGYTYIGTLYKSGTNTTFSHVNVKTISGTEEYIGRRNSNGWDWQELALKSDFDVSGLHFMRKASLTSTSITIVPSYGRQSFMIVVNKNSTKDRQLWMVGLFNGEMSAVRIDSGSSSVSFSFNASAGTYGTITISSLTTYSIIDVMSSDAFT